MECHKYRVANVKLNRSTYECHGFQYDMFKFPLKLPQHALTCSILLVQWIKKIFLVHVSQRRKVHLNAAYAN